MIERLAIRVALVILTAFVSFALSVDQKTGLSNRSLQQHAPNDGSVPDEKAPQKYREVFFPNGMPVEQDPESGKRKQSVYAFYDEAKIGDSGVAVLYSKMIPGETGDANYNVYLGLLAKSEAGWSVAQTTDLTEFMPVETEGPGNFYRMDGRLNPFMISTDISGLHVNLWAVLAGTGSVSGASDLFFRMGPENKLQLLLNLKETSKYSRLGASDSTIVDSKIFVGDIDGDGKAEIIVEKTGLETAPGKRQLHSEKPALYKFRGDQYRLEGTIETSQVASHSRDLIALARSRFIRLVTPAKAGTAASQQHREELLSAKAI